MLRFILFRLFSDEVHTMIAIQKTSLSLRVGSSSALRKARGNSLRSMAVVRPSSIVCSSVGGFVALLYTYMVITARVASH